MSAMAWFTVACVVAFVLLIASWLWVRSLSEDEDSRRLNDDDHDPY